MYIIEQSKPSPLMLNWTHILNFMLIDTNGPKFKVGDHMKISKYKIIFTKGYNPNWSEEVFLIWKVKNIVPCTCVLEKVNVKVSGGKVMIICLTVGSIKRISLYKMIYYPEPGSHSKKKIKNELDLSNYATKFDLKGAIETDTSGCAKKTDLAKMKTNVDKLDIDKMKTVPTDLSKLRDVVLLHVLLE